MSMDILQNTLRKISGAHGMQAAASQLENIEFVITENLSDPKAAAEFIPGTEGRGRINVRKSMVEKGESWELMNALVHEITHFLQFKHPELAPYFKIIPDATEAASVALLMELDAYVRTQMIMDDLQSSGKAPMPAQPRAFSNQVAGLYEQIKDAGYDHESGAAGQVLFRSLLDAGSGFCASYVLPRSISEYSSLAELNQTVIENAVAPGQLHADDIHLQAVGPLDIASTPLGKLYPLNFMHDDEGQTAFLASSRLLKSALPKEQYEQFVQIAADRDAQFEALRPYVATERAVQPQRNADFTTTIGLTGKSDGGIV